VPLIVAVFLAFWLARALVMAWRSRRAIWPTVRQDVDGIAVMAGGAFVTILPLGVYILQNWEIFTGRIRKIGIMDEVARAGSWEPVRANFFKALSMFHWQGDGAALNNLPGAPMFDTLVAMLFILGMGYSLWYALQLRALPVLYILWFVGILSLGVFSATHEAPTARRTIGIAPLGYLMVALVADQVFARWRQTWRGMGNRVLGFATAALVIVVVFGNGRTYFEVQALHPDVWAAYSPVESAIGRYLVDLPADATVLVDPRFEHHSAVRLIGRERPFRAFDPIRDIPFRGRSGDVASASVPGEQLIYVLDPVDKPLVALLETIYPTGMAQEHRDRYERLHFLSFAVGIAQAQAMQGLVGRFYPAAQPEGAPVATLATPALDLDLAQAPLAPPFNAVWSGTLLVDEFGEYLFDLRSVGDNATLQIDQQAALSVRDAGQNTLTMTLPAGFHSLRLDYASGADPGRLQVRWSGPRSDEEILGAGALYAFDLGQRGLIGYYYPNAGWQDPPALVRTDLLITANTLLPVPYSVRWLGKLAAPVSGDYILGTRSDDGSFVYVDGQLVVDNGGVHGAEERQGAIYLEQGFHDIEVRYFEDGGSRELQLWWQPPGQGRSVVDNSYLFPLSGAALPADLALPSLPAIAAELAPVGTESGELDSATQLPGAATIVASGFQQPRGIAVDAAGRLYVAESATGKVQVLEPDGTRFSVLPPGADRFQEPTDVIADVAGVSVLDGVGRVLQYTSDGELRAKFGEGTLSFDRARGVGGDLQGKVWVANTPAGTVLAFDAGGALTQQLPVWPGEDAQPVDVQVGLDGRIFVTDAGRARLVRYGADGQRERAWNIAPANSVDSPHLALDAQGRLYMTEPESGRVLKLDSSGELLGIWDLPAQLGRFVKPVGIAVGPDGRVWVTDADGGNVIVIEQNE
jgi:DNA-binding beta-propeller fold protein YncE